MFQKSNRQIYTALIFSMIFGLTLTVPQTFAGNLPAKNLSKVSVTKTKVVETAALPAEPLSEEALTQNLLSKLKKDYKTANIVIALDEVTSPIKTNGKVVYQGSGEVRIGFDWQKIDYTVALDTKSDKVSKIEYDVKK